MYCTFVMFSLATCLLHPAAFGKDVLFVQGATDFHRQWAASAFAGLAMPATPYNRLTVEREEGSGDTKACLSAVGSVLVIGDKSYIRGIGTNATSVLQITLVKPAAKFIADIGLDGNVKGTTPASVRFYVTAGGKDLFATPVLRPNDGMRHIEVPLAGAREFRLKVDDGGDGRNCDQADWGDARVVLEDGTELYLDEMMSQTAVSAQLPFSFVYGGRPSREFIGSWKRACKLSRLNDGTMRYTLTLSDPKTAFEVRAVALIYQDTQGVDWTIYFTNKGKKDSPILEQVKPVDIVINPRVQKTRAWLENEYLANWAAPDPQTPPKGTADPILHRMHGIRMAGLDYGEFTPIDESLKMGKRIEFNSSSSTPVSPFFTLEWPGGGVVTGVGWTGPWEAAVERDKKAGALHLEVGKREMRLKLHPGESIRSPRILQVYWSGGDQYDGYNYFRQTMIRHIVPKIDGQTVTPPIVYTGSAFPEMNATTQQIEETHIAAAKGLGFEFYWLDAYWLKGGYVAGVGEYGFPIKRVPDPVRFPNGIYPVSAAAHKAEMNFLLWLAPEIVVPGTALDKEHPEWILRGVDPKEIGTFNLGNPQARVYMTKYLNTIIKQYKMGCWRTDSGYGISQLRSNDKDPDRQGISEIRYVEGLYQMWDDLRKTNPHIFIDNCDGGGQRIDLETSARSIPLWRTDGAVWTHFGKDAWPHFKKDYEKISVQNQVISAGLNRYVPFSTGGQSGAQPYYFRSGFNGGITFCEDLRKSDFPRDLFKQAVAEGKRIRKYWFGNFYPLYNNGPSPKDWCVMQYHRPKESDGIVLAFRRHLSPYVDMTCSLREIDPQAIYQVTQASSYQPSEPVRMKGSDLAHLKIEINEQPGSMLVEYKMDRH